MSKFHLIQFSTMIENQYSDSSFFKGSFTLSDEFYSELCLVYFSFLSFILQLF